MADLREDFVVYVVKALVSNPDAVNIERLSDDKGEYIALTVDPTDMGKVIGKAGGTAKSIRTLLRVVGAKDNLTPLPLKIVEPEGSEMREESSAAPVAVDAEGDEALEPQPEAEEEEDPKASDRSDEHDKTRKEMEELADLEL